MHYRRDGYDGLQIGVTFIAAGMAWFGVDARPYLVAAQSRGTSGVLDTFSDKVQADTQRYMGNGTVANR